MGANNRENCTEIDASGAAVMIQSHVSTLILLGSTVYATRAGHRALAIVMRGAMQSTRRAWTGHFLLLCKPE
jgi:hypothetical protein